MIEVNRLFLLQNPFKIHAQTDVFHLFIITVGDLEELVLRYCVWLCLWLHISPSESISNTSQMCQT